VGPLPVDVAVGLAFLGAGIAAWRRRPDNRMGPLMFLAGMAWFGQHVSDLSTNLFLALVAHQVIVFPYGVIRGWLEQLLVGSAYALAIGGYIVSEVFPSTNSPLAALAIPLLLAILFLVVRRWLAATPPERRILEPILWAGPPVLVVAAVAVAHDYLDAIRSDAVDWLKLVYIAIPAAFLVGVLRTQLQRASVVLDLLDVTSPKEIQESLARTLGDPSVRLAFKLPTGQYIDADGKPAEIERTATTLENVVLMHDESLLQEPELVRSAAAAARLPLENARMQAELRAQLERRREQEGSQARLDFVTAPADRDALAELTTRELEVLALVAEGRTDRGIAQALYVTPKTVEAHIRSIFRKLDLPADSTLENRRVHAVLTFLRSN
jgi:DNA-binding CsgD family transcriptional regulator